MSGSQRSPDLPAADPGIPLFVVAAAACAVLGAMWLVVRPPHSDVPGPSAADEVGQGSIPRVRTGSDIFVAEGCGTCHITSGPSTALQPSLEGALGRAARRLQASDYSGSATTPEEYLREAILDHCADTLPGYSCEGAPDVGLRLGPAEFEALVAFVADLEGEAE